MSWVRRLVGTARGDEGAGKALQLRLLAPIYSALTGLSAQVQAHAQMAPTAPIEEELDRLGRAIGAQAERVGSLLTGQQIDRPEASLTNGAVQPNHWARLVHDLEQLREVRRLLLDAYARLNEVEPTLAAELEDCGRQVEQQLHRLRGLIARADPQALN